MKRKKLIKSEVKKLFNTTSETLRYYEDKGLIHPDIEENNYRYYDFFDLQRLRQIFLFRDLGIPINSIKHIMNEEINEKEYIHLLKKHQQALKSKIQTLETTYQNVSQLMTLVMNESLNYAFEIKYNPERVFYVVDSIDSNIMSCPKKYFDKYKSVINDAHYSEKALHIVYDYKALNTGQHIASKICFEVLKPRDLNDCRNEEIGYSTFLAGDYLSVFYEFKRENFKGLKLLKRIVDEYLIKHDYTLKDPRVIEIEHPELSLFLEKDTYIYEIQILVERK